MRIAMPAIPPVPPALAAHWSNIALFLLLSCSMLIKPSNFLAPLMLLAASVPAWRSWKRELVALPREFRWFCWAVCLLAISWLLDSLLSGQGLRLDKALKIIALVPCALYLLRRPPQAVWLWLGAALGAIACGLVAIYQVQVLHLPREGNTYINPIEFGDTSTQLALLCLCGTQAVWRHPRRMLLVALLIAGFTLGITGSVLSGTRGAWLAGLIALAFLGWWYVGQHSKRLLAVLVVCMGASCIMMAQYGPIHARLQAMHQEINRYRLQGHAATSVGARLQMWQFASALTAQRPLTGWGQKGYDAERLQQVEQGRLDPLLGGFNHPHNDYLDASAKRGIPGLLILLACHLCCLLYFWRAAKRQPQTGDAAERQALCAAGMLLPVLFAGFGLTDTHITSSRTVVMYFYLAAFIMALLERADAPRPASASTPARPAA